MIRKATLNDKNTIATIWRKDSAFLGALYMGALKERIEKQMVNVFEQNRVLPLEMIDAGHKRLLLYGPVVHEMFFFSSFGSTYIST